MQNYTDEELNTILVEEGFRGDVHNPQEIEQDTIEDEVIAEEKL